MSYFQLPDTINKDIPTIQLNIHPDEKAKDLIKHLLYLAQIEDPIFQNKVEDLIRNDEELQSYLFATEDLNRTLDESLQLAVGHGKINDAAKVRHELERNDKTYKYFQKNDNPLDVVFREKAKFDVQNPIIDSLLDEINKGKAVTEDDRIKAIKGAPNPADLDVEDRFNKLFDKKRPGPKDGLVDPDDNDSDDDDDDDFDLPNPPNFPPISPEPRGPPSPHLPEVRPKPGEPGDGFIDTRNPQEYFFPFSGRKPEVTCRLPRPVKLDKNLKDVFGEAEAVLNESSAPPLEKNTFKDFSNQLDRGKTPQEIQFYRGGEGVNQLQRQIIESGLEIGNEEFVNFLASEECQTALARDGISIHVPSGQIFVENENTGEFLFDFLKNQQDETKKKIPLDFTYDDDYYDYVTKYLPGIS